jgi:formyl-CoA transferase
MNALHSGPSTKHRRRLWKLFKRPVWLQRRVRIRKIAILTRVMETLQAAGVAAAPCADTEDRYFDPHFQEREIIVNIDHPATGVDFVPKVVCNLSETPGEIRRPAPLLGEHNNYVFGELLGLSKDEIEALVEKKVIY